ncbi:MAG: tRNA pseudouridine(55) synthase TruB [Oscillospiraceae bacterium]|nr:tRNA pseudouridine(55) synthase TruB [Oscillospiraceae bacterium]
MNGIVIVDKPEGWTSQDVTARLRRVFNTRRIGHGGTLDPMATGVLPVFVGRATRGVEFFEHAEKMYEATLRLGINTDTEDITGAVLEQKEVAISEQEFLNILTRFRGKIQQIPPMYSALKVNGQKLCDLARKGKEVERQPREIEIFRLECLEFSGKTARLLVHCSKGTYIRTLCKDIGEALGCGGCMASLRRVSAGEYRIEESVPLQTLLETEEPEQYLRTVDTMFRQFPAVTLTPNQEKRCRNGNPFSLNIADGTYRAYGQSGEFLMLAKVEAGIMSTIKLFFEVSQRLLALPLGELSAKLTERGFGICRYQRMKICWITHETCGVK